MAAKKELRTVCIYKYGIRNQPERQYAEQMIEEFRKANRFYNQLVEIERWKTETFRAIRRKLFPSYERNEAEEQKLVESILACRDGIKKANAAARKRIVNKEAAAKIAEVKDQLSKLRTAMKAMRDKMKLNPKLIEAGKRIDEEANAKVKAARKERKCSWGTGGEIEDSVKQASQKSHGMPKFRAWDGGGKFVVQIQSGLTAPKLIAGSNTQVQLDQPEEFAELRQIRGKRRQVEMRMRIGSDADRNPVWVHVPVLLQRPIPQDSVVKRAFIKMRRIGKRLVWEAGFVLYRESGWEKTDRAKTGTIALDVGWRRLGNGLRVAYWVDDAGQKGELFLSGEWLRRWELFEGMQSERDKAFNTVRDQLATWMSTRQPGPYNAPEWLIEATETLKQWRSANRLWNLVSRWMRNRFPGDENIMQILFSWWRQERKDHDGIDGGRRKLINQREEIYRQFAVMIRRNYKTVKVESVNWAAMRKRKDPEQTPTDAAMTTYARLAAPGRLMELIHEHASNTVGIPANNTTKACHECGFVHAEMDGRDLMQKCPQCGLIADMDYRAAMNLLNAKPEGKKKKGEAA